MKENQQVEWKESWRDEFLKAVCAFANSDGGVLVIGRNNKGKVVGLANAHKLLEELPNKIRDLLGIVVKVNLRGHSSREYLEIVVEAYPNPISYRGEYYVRSGSTTQALKGAALYTFLLRKQGRNWDGVPDPTLRLKDCSAQALRLFAKNATRSGRMDSAVLRDGRGAVLENLELMEGQYLKRAAGLLFSDRPESRVSGAWIKTGFFFSDDDLRHQDEVHGNLFEQVENTLKVLESKYLKAYISYEGLQRLETYLFPMEAVREALLNAVIHKDYSSGIPIQISVYEDKIVLWNPGELPQNWTLKKLLGKHPSKPFNPLLANALFRAGFIESWGRGIEKIRRACEEHGIEPPVYDLSMSGLMVTFHANPQHLAAATGGANGTTQETTPKTTQETQITTPETQPTTPETTQETRGTTPETQITTPETRATTPETQITTYPGTTQEKILGLLRTQPHVSSRALAAQLGLTRDGIRYHLRKLTLEGIIRHVGPTKAGYWEVLEAPAKAPAKATAKATAKETGTATAKGTGTAMATAMAREAGRGTSPVQVGATAEPPMAATALAPTVPMPERLYPVRPTACRVPTGSTTAPKGLSA